MNSKERAMLLRLESIIDDIPRAAAGNQSSSMSGVFSFAKDMDAIKRPLSQVLNHLRNGEHEDAEMMLSAMEIWRDARKSVDWANVRHSPQVEVS